MHWGVLKSERFTAIIGIGDLESLFSDEEFLTTDVQGCGHTLIFLGTEFQVLRNKPSPMALDKMMGFRSWCEGHTGVSYMHGEYSFHPGREQADGRHNPAPLKSKYSVLEMKMEPKISAVSRMTMEP